jgi:hypothetical protein
MWHESTCPDVNNVLCRVFILLFILLQLWEIKQILSIEIFLVLIVCAREKELNWTNFIQNIDFRCTYFSSVFSKNNYLRELFQTKSRTVTRRKKTEVPEGRPSKINLHEAKLNITEQPTWTWGGSLCWRMLCMAQAPWLFVVKSTDEQTKAKQKLSPRNPLLRSFKGSNCMLMASGHPVTLLIELYVEWYCRPRTMCTLALAPSLFSCVPLTHMHT